MLILTTGCTETQLVAHMAKQIPFPGHDDAVGKFKIGDPYTVAGKTYYPRERYQYTQTGIASWYGSEFHGRPTANGEIFDRHELTAAHRTLQLPSLVRVTNLENGRSLVVRVNDRGPFKRGRIIDLSERASELLQFKDQGTAKVRLEILGDASRSVARAAKRGIDTSGTEVALNRNPSARLRLASATGNARQPVADSGSAANSAVDERRKTKARELARRVPITRNAVGAGPSQNKSQNVREIAREPLESRKTQKTDSQENMRKGRASLKKAEDDLLPGHVRDGAFYPDEQVARRKVEQTEIFVQAGSFTRKSYAQRLSRSLGRVAPTVIEDATVRGREFYRVRLGPLDTVARADNVLNRVIGLGHNDALIVVD